MNKTFTVKKKDENRHKLTTVCFNKCIEWKLTASITHNKTSIGYTFNAKSLFFKYLEASILNTLQNNNNNHKVLNKTNLKSFEEKSNDQLTEKKTEKLNENENEVANEILNVKFPIDNSEFNFMIIDANLGITDNLKNIFFLEFDLSVSQNSKEQLKMIREITNESVNKEIFFMLNGKIHETPLFRSDIKFSVEIRKFIKSMQFRLENFKNELIEKEKNKPTGKKSKIIELPNNFYSKIITNINIGIEFTKPTLSEFIIENLPTNFNTIVNSNILLNKIFLEVCIPKIFINRGLTLSCTSNKASTVKVNPKIVPPLKIDQVTNSSNNNNSMSYININTNNSSVNNTDTRSRQTDDNFRTSRTIFHSNKTMLNKNYFENDINRCIKSKGFHSKPLSPVNSFKTNVAINLQANYRSPEFVSKPHPNYHHLAAGMFVTPSHNFSSPSSYNPYNRQNSLDNSNLTNFQNSMDTNFFCNRKLSENTSDHQRRNHPLSTTGHFMNKTMSIISSPPMYMRVYPDMMFNYPMHNSFIGNMHHVGNVNFNLNGLNSNLLSTGFVSPRAGFYRKTMEEMESCDSNVDPYNVSSVHQKIKNWEKLNNNKENENENENDDSKDLDLSKDNNFDELNINSATTSDTLSAMKYKTFVNYNEGSCNFLLFQKQCTPCMKSSNKQNTNRITVQEFFKSFDKVSLHGLDLTYCHESELVTSTYTATLSSMELTFTSRDLVLEITEELIRLKKCSPDIRKQTHGENVEIYLTDINLKLIIKNKFSSITFEFYENRPPHSRQILIKQIDQLISFLGDKIKRLQVSSIERSSWFSVLWTPFKSSKGIFLNTSFLVYYQFSLKFEDNTKFSELPLIGILPIKFDRNIFITKIIKEKRSLTTNIFNTQPIYETLEKFDNIQNNFLFKNSIENVHNFVIKHTNKSSIDYEFYLKNCIN